MRDGYHTGRFGAWLEGELKAASSRYQVFYDHGDPQNENVGAIQGFVGESARQTNILTNTDVMVANPNGEILLLIEIEESELSPKKLIGDIMATAMSTGFSFGAGAAKGYFKVTPRTQAVIAGVVNIAGGKKKQLEEVIVPRLKDFSFPEDNIPLKRFRFVLEGDIGIVIAALQGLCCELLA